MVFCCFDDKTRCKIEEIQDELIGMLCFDAELVKRLTRKIHQIASHDNTGSATDRRCQDMPVLFIWKNKTRNQMFISRYKRIWSGFIHELSRSLQFLTGKIRTMFQETANPFFMHVGGPFGAKHSDQRKVHENVTQLRWIKHVGVIENNECGHNQIPISWS